MEFGWEESEDDYEEVVELDDEEVRCCFGLLCPAAAPDGLEWRVL